MRQSFVGLALLLSQITWGDGVYFNTGRVWQNVEVVDAKQTTSGALVLIQPIAAEAPTAISGGWWPGVMHIEFGDDPPSSSLVFRSPHPPIVGVVERAVDATTLDLSMRRRIRLIGVDAPVTLGQFFTREATAFAQRLATGQKVWIEFDKQKFDNSGRLVGYVYILPSGTFLNETIIENGCGRADLKCQSPVSYLERFCLVEREAHRAGLGLWNQRAALEFVQKGIEASSGPREDWMPSLTGPDTEERVPTYRMPSSPSGTAKSVWVRGYYRKDGTYVRGYYRSRPSH